MQIPAHVVAFLGELSGGMFATRDAQNRPTLCETLILSVDAETGICELAMVARFARNAAENLADNGRFAFITSRVWGDHHSVQLKGTCLEVRGPWCDPRQAASAETLVRAFMKLGYHEDAVGNFRTMGADPAWQLRVQIDEVFDQTPGPGAGRPVR